MGGEKSTSEIGTAEFEVMEDFQNSAYLSDDEGSVIATRSMGEWEDMKVESEFEAEVDEGTVLPSPFEIPELPQAASGMEVHEDTVVTSPCQILELPQTASGMEDHEDAVVTSPCQIPELSQAASGMEVDEDTFVTSPCQIPELPHAASGMEVHEDTVVTGPCQSPELPQAAFGMEAHECLAVTSPCKIPELPQVASCTEVHEGTVVTSPCQNPEVPQAAFGMEVHEGTAVTSPRLSPELPQATFGMDAIDNSNIITGLANANLHGNVAEVTKEVGTHEGGVENCDSLNDTEKEKGEAPIFLRGDRRATMWKLGMLKAHFSVKASLAVVLVAALYGIFLSCPCLSDRGGIQDTHPACLPMGLFCEIGHVGLSFGKLVVEELRHCRHHIDRIVSSSSERAVLRRMNARPIFGKTLQSLQDARERAEGSVLVAVETVAAADRAELGLRNSLAALRIGKLSPHFQKQMYELVSRAREIARHYREHVDEFQTTFLAERSIFNFLSNRIHVLFEAMLRGDETAVESIIRSMGDRVDRFHARIKELKLKHDSLKELVYSLRHDFHEFKFDLEEYRANAEHAISINKIWSWISGFFSIEDPWARKVSESGEATAEVSGTLDSLEAVLAELHKRSSMYSVILNNIVEARNAADDATMKAPPGYGAAYSAVVVEDLLGGFQQLAESYTELLIRSMDAPSAILSD